MYRLQPQVQTTTAQIQQDKCSPHDYGGDDDDDEEADGD